jgi:hypothetical protein
MEEARKAAEELEAQARAMAAKKGFVPSWALDPASQAGWKTLKVAEMTPQELDLLEDVLKAPEVIVGRSTNVKQRGMLVLDEWLEQRGIKWTQQWQDVYNKSLYLRTSTGSPVNVMAGGGYSAAEVAAAEEGAAVGGIRNTPFWSEADIGKDAVKAGENVAVKEVGKVAAKEAEQVAAKSGRLWTRLAGKFGAELLEGLVPSPLDAVGLMIDFLESFAEARAAIRERNLKSGVAIGLAAYLVIPRWEWAKQFAHTTVSRDVITEILSAAGVAENAFNEGLVRGFLFGERHSREQANSLRQQAFDSVLRQGRSVGRYMGDDQWKFDRDDVYTFAGVLLPTAEWFLGEADRRRKAREAAERERKAAERLRQQEKRWASVPIGADKW